MDNKQDLKDRLEKLFQMRQTAQEERKELNERVELNQYTQDLLNREIKKILSMLKGE